MYDKKISNTRNSFWFLWTNSEWVKKNGCEMESKNEKIRVIENSGLFRISLVLMLFTITFLNFWHHFVCIYLVSLFLSSPLSFSEIFLLYLWYNVTKNKICKYSWSFVSLVYLCFATLRKTTRTEQEIHDVSNY